MQSLFVANNKPYIRLDIRQIDLILQRLGDSIGDNKVHSHKFGILAIKKLTKACQ